jgi:hypothetical protein
MEKHTFELKPSLVFRYLAIFLFVGGEFCLISIRFTWWLAAIFALFYGIGFYYFWRHHVLMRGNKMIAKFWHSGVDANNWHLINNEKVEHLAKLLPSSVIHPFLLILHFDFKKMEKREFISMVIFKDMLPAKDFRHLFVDIMTSKSD